MNTITIDEAKKWDRDLQAGDSVAFQDHEGRVRIGTTRIREIRCGKKNCTKCPHKRYAYAQYRVGKKVKSKYIGVVK